MLKDYPLLFKVIMHTLLSLMGMLLMLSLLFNNPSCSRVGIFLMLFQIFPCICILSLAERLIKFLGVLTLEHIIWLNGPLPT
jgi:hypothetical protein